MELDGLEMAHWTHLSQQDLYLDVVEEASADMRRDGSTSEARLRRWGLVTDDSGFLRRPCFYKLASESKDVEKIIKEKKNSQ